MRSKILLVIAAIFITLNSIAQAFTSSVRRFISDSAKIIALVDAKIIDGTGGPSKINQTIIIANGRIEQLGKVKDITIPKGADIINCTDKTIIPGMVILPEVKRMVTARWQNYQNNDSDGAVLFKKEMVWEKQC